MSLDIYSKLGWLGTPGLGDGWTGIQAWKTKNMTGQVSRRDPNIVFRLATAEPLGEGLRGSWAGIRQPSYGPYALLVTCLVSPLWVCGSIFGRINLLNVAG